jgi:hypothetical protein
MSRKSPKTVSQPERFFVESALNRKTSFKIGGAHEKKCINVSYPGR